MIDSANRKSRSEWDAREPSDLVASSAMTDAESQLNQLLLKIYNRIESRLPGRIRDLQVSASKNAIVLRGHCSTYYTKQVAQHTARGVLEYERLINNIDVRMPK